MRSTFDLRIPVAPDRARAVALTVVAAAFTYLATQRALVSGPLVLLAVAGAALAVLILERPRLATLVLLIVSAPLHQEMRRQVSIGGLTTDAFEVLAYGLVAYWVISRGRTARMPSWQFAGPVLLLFAGAVVGAAWGLMHAGVNRYLLIGQFKSYLVYLLILPLTALFSTLAEKQRLERWVVNFCVVGSVIVLGAAAIGSTVPTEAPQLALNTFGETVQVQRLRPSMLWLLFLATLLVLGRVFVHGMTRRSAVQLALFFGVWVFSFNRSSWAALVICGGLLALLRPGPRRPGRGLRTAAVAALLLPLLLGTAATGLFGPTISAVPARLESLVNPAVLSEHSVRDRADEYPVVFRALARNPVLGVGLGRPYGARRPFFSPRLGVVVYEDRPYSHNSLLFAYLHLGLLGMAALAWIGVAAWRAAVNAVRTLPTDVALRVLVASLALLGYGIQSISQTSLLHRPGITAAVIAMVLATRPREVPRA